MKRMISQEMIDYAKSIMQLVSYRGNNIYLENAFINEFNTNAIYDTDNDTCLAIYSEGWCIRSKVKTGIEPITVTAPGSTAVNVIVHSNGANGTILSGSVVMPADTAVEITISGISNGGMSLYDVCPLFAMSDLATPTLKVQFPTWSDSNEITFGFASGPARTVAFSWIAGTLSYESE